MEICQKEKSSLAIYLLACIIPIVSPNGGSLTTRVINMYLLMTVKVCKISVQTCLPKELQIYAKAGQFLYIRSVYVKFLYGSKSKTSFCLSSQVVRTAHKICKVYKAWSDTVFCLRFI